MPDPLVVLDRVRIPVQPGSQATVRVRITNTDLIVNGFRIEVVGRGPADWAEAGPSEVRMMPHEDETVVITFSPPAGPSAPGGTYPFGVRAVSLEDDHSSSVAEGDLDVGAVVGLHAKLVPLNSAGRWQGKHTIQIANSGNTAARLKLVGSDVDEALGFLIRPEVLDVGLGATSVARIRVRGRRPFLRGVPVRLPFTVVAEPEGRADAVVPAATHTTPERPVIEGSFTQRPILARFVLPFIIFALVVGTSGVIYQLNRPLPALQKLGDGSVPTVEGLTATAVDAHTVQLTWYRVAGVDRYFIQRYSGNGRSPEQSYPASSQDVALPIADLRPGEKKCFTIRAIRRDLDGAESRSVCATTPAEPRLSGSPLTTSPPVTTPPVESPKISSSTPPALADLVGKYVAVGAYAPQSSTDRAFYDPALRTLINERLTTAQVVSTDELTFEYPRVQTPSWVVVAGPYDTEEFAKQDACPRMEKVFKAVCRASLVQAK